MLRKMYLVSEDHINKTKNQNPPQKEPTRKYTPPKNNKKRKKNNNSQHDYEKWLAMRNEIREDAIRHNTQIKAIADLLQKVLPSQQQQRK
jgi:hypothetical protein